jgi:signal transduction histidine kinase
VGYLADQLNGQGTLIIQLTQDDPMIWTSPLKALEAIEQVKPNVIARIMLLNNKGQLLASSLNADQQRIGQHIDFPVVRQAMHMQTNWLIDYSPFMGTRILDMAIPVLADDNSLMGIVRLSYDITAIEQRTLPLGGSIAVAFFLGTAAALAFGVGLARSVNAPLSRLTQAIANLKPGSYSQILPETGPEEVRIVAQNYNEMTRRLNELERSRQQFIANIVHELGTPLGAIKAAAEALQGGAVSDPALAAELALGIDNQVDQMRMLVDDITLLGASEIKPIVLNREWCNLEELIQTQCYAYAYWTKKKQIDLAYSIKMDLPAVFVDPHRLNQAVANLLDNAYKYSPRGSKIMISADMLLDTPQAPAMLIIEVSDNGPGIALEEQSRIFDLMYRSPHHRNLDKGMGIGLALSKRLVEAHGGILTVQSTLGQGATFRIALPIDPPVRVS